MAHLPLSDRSPAVLQAGWFGGERIMLTTVLLMAGVLMFCLYIAMDVTASLLYDGYSYKDQTISELSATGAPTRTFWIALGVPYQVLAVAFAAGVLAIAGRRRRLQVAGWLLAASAVLGFLWWFAPMHQREALADGGGNWQDTMHLALGGANSIVFFAMIGVAAFAFGRGFRWYSLCTVVLMLIFGILMNMGVERVGNNEPTPWLGIWERIAIEGAMLWQAVLAMAALRMLWVRPKRAAVADGR